MIFRQKRRGQRYKYANNCNLQNDNRGGEVCRLFNADDQNGGDHRNYEKPNIVVFQMHGQAEYYEVRSWYGRKTYA